MLATSWCKLQLDHTPTPKHNTISDYCRPVSLVVVVVIGPLPVLRFMNSTLQDDQLMFSEEAKPVQQPADGVLADKVFLLQDEVCIPLSRLSFGGAYA